MAVSAKRRPITRPLHEIHVVTPDGARWVLDIPAIRSPERAALVFTAVMNWMHACERSGSALPAAAKELRTDLLLAGIDPLNCAIELVRQAQPSADAPNGWETVTVAAQFGAVMDGRYRLDQGHACAVPHVSDPDDDADDDDFDHDSATALENEQ